MNSELDSLKKEKRVNNKEINMRADIKLDIELD